MRSFRIIFVKTSITGKSYLDLYLKKGGRLLRTYTAKDVDSNRVIVDHFIDQVEDLSEIYFSCEAIEGGVSVGQLFAEFCPMPAKHPNYRPSSQY